MGNNSLAIFVDFSIKGDDAVAVMKHLQALHGTQQRIQVDNGSEFISKVLELWVYENDVTLVFTRPGKPSDNPYIESLKPSDNPYIESFNGSFRDECLNMHWFLCLEDAREKIEVW